MATSRSITLNGKLAGLNLADPPRLRPVSFAVVGGTLRLLDLVAVLASGLTAGLLWSQDVGFERSALVLLFLAMLAGNANCWHLAGAYRPETLLRRDAGLERLLLCWILTCVLLVGVAGLLGRWDADSAKWIGAWLGCGALALTLLRVALAIIVRRWAGQGRLTRVVAILGVDEAAQRMVSRLHRQGAAWIQIAGLFTERREPGPRSCFGHPVLGGIEDLLQHARRNRVDAVVIALPDLTRRRLELILWRLREIAVDVQLCPYHTDVDFDEAQGDTKWLGGMPTVTIERKPFADWKAIVKSAEDRILAAGILLFIAPVLLIIAALIKLDSPGPVLFRQKRYGLNNHMIEVFKFRTMYADDCDIDAVRLVSKNDSRVTRLGAFLRRTSLDELPQFLNVLRGDMSIVGPRPHAPAAKAGGLLYDEAVATYHARHRVKPGITGWAQVNGWRGETRTIEQIQGRVDHDLYYIANWSLLLDLRIILRTAFGGFTGRQAY